MLNCGFSDNMLSSWFNYLIFLLCLMNLAYLSSLSMSFSMLNFNMDIYTLKLTFSMLNMIPLLMVMTISFLVLMWSRFYMNNTSSQTLFFFTLFLFVVSMMLLILSNSLMMIFLGWEGLGITSFLLIIYYQNWSSFQGGLLTLLTNRIGDGVLMLSFGYWILQFSYLKLVYMNGALLSILFLFLTFTKSAQVPFTSWLPAAMAAPTPVSALVHSSTLVTAGVWLLIKYNNKLTTTSSILLIIGISTLTLASTAALMETDGKKIVALSTLSQLGLMFLALSLGGYFICLFHLVMHAFAKANLFLVVGNFIHARFSLQDVRFMGSSFQSSTLSLMMMISIISLSGVTFTSGFFSKDLILMTEFSLFNSIMTMAVVMMIVTFTWIYCLKLVKMFLTNTFPILSTSSSSFSMSPSIILSFFSLTLGYFFMKNASLISVSKVSGAYWSYLLLVGLIFPLALMTDWSKLFISQQKIISKLNLLIMTTSKKTITSSTTILLEGNYLTSSFLSTLTSSVTTKHVILLLLTMAIVATW